MVCKEEVVQWFKDLDSYKRIDTLCTLLNMCLPFELRFVGTCVEELGGLFSKDFRGVEVRVNNGSELAQDIQSAQLCDPADGKVRRKWVLYFSLIRGYNRPMATDLFNILYSWRYNAFLKQAEGEALNELLLVFMMAANHPVFSFEQRTRCGEVYNMIYHGRSDAVYAEMPAADSTDDAVHSAASASTSNATQAAVDQSRGSQIVNTSPQHAYPESGQPAPAAVHQQNATHGYPAQATNVAPSTRTNALATAQAPPPPPPPLLPPPTHQHPQQAPAHQHHKSTNPTNLSYSMQNLNLDGNSVVYVDTDGIPGTLKPESGSASSTESVDDSTPPGTPHTSSGVSSSSSFKQHRVRSDSKSSTSSSTRHSQVSMAVAGQPQTHLVFGTAQMIPVSVPITGDMVHAPNVVTSVAAVMPAGFTIASQPVHLQPQMYGGGGGGGVAQLHKSQMTTPYQYHTQAMPMAVNRVLTTYAPTQGQPVQQQQQPTAAFRVPSTPTYLQPNGEVLHYPYPPTIAFTQAQPMPPPPRQPSGGNLTPQHLPTITSLSSKASPPNVLQSFVLDPNTKPGVSCFNCGAASHSGQDCTDATMEEMNRHYKLDYNSIIDTADRAAGELIDNGNSGVRGSNDAIAHIAPTVLNK